MRRVIRKIWLGVGSATLAGAPAVHAAGAVLPSTRSQQVAAPPQGSTAQQLTFSIPFDFRRDTAMTTAIDPVELFQQAGPVVKGVIGQLEAK